MRMTAVGRLARRVARRGGLNDLLLFVLTCCEAGRGSRARPRSGVRCLLAVLTLSQYVCTYASPGLVIP